MQSSRRVLQAAQWKRVVAGSQVKRAVIQCGIGKLISGYEPASVLEAAEPRCSVRGRLHCHLSAPLTARAGLLQLSCGAELVRC